MDKKELYKEVEGLDKFCLGIRKYVALNEVMYLIKQLDEPQKVVIPQYVADWLKYCKLTGVDLYHALEMGDLYFCNYANQKDDLKLQYFFETENNQETFVRAWLFGYEVEKEKKYIFKFKNIMSGTSYLKYDTVVEKWYFGIKQDTSTTRLFHTKDELTEGGFDWIFSCEGIEVKEVQDDSKV